MPGRFYTNAVDQETCGHGERNIKEWVSVLLNKFAKHKRRKTASVLTSALIVFTVLFIWSVTAFSATNVAVNQAGGGVSLVPSGPVTVNSVQLALNKQARDLAGVVLPGGSNVSSGQNIYFVLYIDNTTGTPANDIRISDFLNETEFTYIPNSIETTLVPSGSNDAAIWASVWTPLTDVVGAPDDSASITDSGGPAGLDQITVGAETGQVNQVLNIPGNVLQAIRFRVTVN